MEAAEKGGYDHFLLKEIYEQPKAVADTLNPRIKDNEIDPGHPENFHCGLRFCQLHRHDGKIYFRGHGPDSGGGRCGQ